MLKIKALAYNKLQADLAKIPWASLSEVPLRSNGYNPLQPRAMQALDLALTIADAGFNIYLAGEADLGRKHLLLEYLRPRAAKMPNPQDLVYLYNFQEPDRPILLSLEPGLGKKLKLALADAIEQIASNLVRRFEMNAFKAGRNFLMANYQQARSQTLQNIDKIVNHKGFRYEFDEEGGITLWPIKEIDKFTAKELDNSATILNKQIKEHEKLIQTLLKILQDLGKNEVEFREKARSLEEKVLKEVLKEVLQPLIDKFSKHNAELAEWFIALKADILKNLEFFLPRENEILSISPENSLRRYEVNLFVDNSAKNGAPIIFEEHPTLANVVGYLERESEMGSLNTDFTLIRAGSLQKANSGFLIFYLEDLLDNPATWEALLRTLKNQKLRIEDSEATENLKTRCLNLQALALNLKVILIGTSELYEEIAYTDDRFRRLFRILAELEDKTLRKSENLRFWLMNLAKIANDAKLLDFDRSALTWLISYASRLAEDQRHISLKFPQIRERMLEANALAKTRNLSMITSEILEEAQNLAYYRNNLTQTLLLEEYERNLIRVPTSGSAIGQVNGLSILESGTYEFGMPHCIVCSVGVGQDGIIDLEREAELGGPIHTKAMMILKSFLTGLFARRKPLILSASIHFEQNYAGIEGDSASGAELAALLSALAEVPMRLDLAFTGALGSGGRILAVGGVTTKIEGFFKICAKRGLTGTQGVIIPQDNLEHLLLAQEVIKAVKEEKFFIYAVNYIEEAMQILTGLNTGRKLSNDSFTKNSLYELVDKRLHNLGRYAQQDFSKRKTKKVAPNSQKTN